MSQNLEPNEALKVLARIIAKAYLAETQVDKRVPRSENGDKRDENISRTSRDSFDGKGDYQS
jgi:hypothetical protein